MDQNKIDRINALARKSREGTPLTEEEKVEQQALRAEYIESFRKSLKDQLDHTVVVDESGNRRRLRQKGLKS